MMMKVPLITHNSLPYLYFAPTQHNVYDPEFVAPLNRIYELRVEGDGGCVPLVLISWINLQL
jgi:hypothetical protein